MSSNNRTVTVVGAGLAGLSAAYDLHRAGWKVTVLEGRARVGGRVYSVRSFSNGLVAEGGGEFIEDRHVRMLAYAKQFNLQLGQVGSWQNQDSDWGALAGKTGRLADESVWGTDLQPEIERMWNAVAGLAQYVPDPKQPQLSRDAQRFDAQSALDWCNTIDVHPIARSYFLQHIRSEYTAEPERFSLLDLARNAAMYYSTAERSSNWRVIGGNDLIPRALADALPDVRMNAVVTSIRILPDEVVVTYKQGDSYQTIQSDYAILAVPLTTA
ncbi:MAG TPA: FAD-dependent oxidoreductase, partial [Anaerolineales bacterium]|nr:FAD-dependent oxidoreductase [Anaerolineales bacterium]